MQSASKTVSYTQGGGRTSVDRTSINETTTLAMGLWGNGGPPVSPQFSRPSAVASGGVLPPRGASHHSGKIQSSPRGKNFWRKILNLSAKRAACCALRPAVEIICIGTLSICLPLLISEVFTPLSAGGHSPGSSAVTSSDAAAATTTTSGVLSTTPGIAIVWRLFLLLQVFGAVCGLYGALRFHASGLRFLLLSQLAAVMWAGIPIILPGVPLIPFSSDSMPYALVVFCCMPLVTLLLITSYWSWSLLVNLRRAAKSPASLLATSTSSSPYSSYYYSSLGINNFSMCSPKRNTGSRDAFNSFPPHFNNSPIAHNLPLSRAWTSGPYPHPAGANASRQVSPSAAILPPGRPRGSPPGTSLSFVPGATARTDSVFTSCPTPPPPSATPRQLLTVRGHQSEAYPVPRTAPTPAEAGKSPRFAPHPHASFLRQSSAPETFQSSPFQLSPFSKTDHLNNHLLNFSSLGEGQQHDGCAGLSGASTASVASPHSLTNSSPFSTHSEPPTPLTFREGATSGLLESDRLPHPVMQSKSASFAA